MKVFFYLLFSTLLSTSLYSDEIAQDKMTEAIAQRKILSPEELQNSKKTFLEFITKYKTSEFTGHTQYVLSALNLSIIANAKYSIETNGTILFQLASAGGNISTSDVTFPMQGSVYFEIKNNEGIPIDFKTEEGEIINFLGTKNIFYIVETEKAFKVRKNIQSKFNRAEKPIGRFLSIARWDLFSQDIEFYEIKNTGEEKILLRRGSFNGTPLRRGW